MKGRETVREDEGWDVVNEGENGWLVVRVPDAPKNPT